MSNRITDPEKVIAALWNTADLMDAKRCHQDEGTFPNGGVININYGSGSVRIRSVMADGTRIVMDLVDDTNTKPGHNLIMEVAKS